MARKDEAYHYLKDSILTNKLAPDEPISEMAISEALHMSRSPIREALRELEREGLIISYPSRGSFVTSLTPYDVEEIYQLRQLLENWALERSINRIALEELNVLEQKFNMAYQNQNWNLFHEADRDLHGLIVENAGSKRLLDFINILYSQIERIRRISAMEVSRDRKSYEEHLEIIQCIRERDIVKGKQTLAEHLRSVSDSAMEVARFYKNK